MTWTLVTSGNASIFSLVNVTTPNTASTSVAASVIARRWTAKSMSLSSTGGPSCAGARTRTICTRRARGATKSRTYTDLRAALKGTYRPALKGTFSGDP